MDKSAIEQIQLSQAIEAARRSINDIGLITPVVALPESFGIKDLESYQIGRSRYRGAMTTGSIDDFTRYCEKHDEMGAACFVQTERMHAKTTFNLGTEKSPGHADFSASLTLDKTAEYIALTELNGSRYDQKSMAEWMEDWAHNLHFFSSDGDTIEASKAIGAVRRLTIESYRKEEHESQDLKASRSVMENIEAKSGNNLPARLNFSCMPYSGLSERTFQLRFSVLTGGDKPTLIARIKRLEEQVQEMGREFSDILNDSFEDSDLEVFLGEFRA